jgi:hypothetical protein
LNNKDLETQESSIKKKIFIWNENFKFKIIVDNNEIENILLIEVWEVTIDFFTKKKKYIDMIGKIEIKLKELKINDIEKNFELLDKNNNKRGILVIDIIKKKNLNLNIDNNDNNNSKRNSISSYTNNSDTNDSSNNKIIKKEVSNLPEININSNYFNDGGGIVNENEEITIINNNNSEQNLKEQTEEETHLEIIDSIDENEDNYNNNNKKINKIIKRKNGIYEVNFNKNYKTVKDGLIFSIKVKKKYFL